MDGSKVVLHLIHITINTLNAQYHSCRPHATAGPLYSDNSNMSRYSEKEKGEVSEPCAASGTFEGPSIKSLLFFEFLIPDFL